MNGAAFAALDAAAQDGLLVRAEKGELVGPTGSTRHMVQADQGNLFLAYGSDPRGMVEMGFPGPSYEPGHVWLERDVGGPGRRPHP